MDEADTDCDRPDASLLSHRGTSLSGADEQITAMTRAGMLRAYWLGAVCCIGGFLFGYDSGIIGQTIVSRLEMPNN